MAEICQIYYVKLNFQLPFSFIYNKILILSPLPIELEQCALAMPAGKNHTRNSITKQTLIPNVEQGFFFPV